MRLSNVMGKRAGALVVLVVVLASAAGWFAYRTLGAGSVTQETDRLVIVLALEPSSSVADVGAGSGAFSLELASRIVQRGHVFATDIDESALATIRAQAAAAHLTNITVIQGAEASANLPTACCDAVFLRGVYHHITKPEEINRGLREALRSLGRLAIIDFEPSWFLTTFFPVRGTLPNRGGHGIRPSVVAAEVERAGFMLIDQLNDWTRGQYCLVFQRSQAVSSRPGGGG